MENENRKPFIRTVLGDIPAAENGVTLCHEHFSMDYSIFTTPGDEFTNTDNPSVLTNYHNVSMAPYSTKFNLRLCDEPLEVMVEEMIKFKEAGGATIVENTVRGITRDVEKLRKISAMSGVNIVAGTGYYLDKALDNEIKGKSTEDLAKIMMTDIESGVESTGIKCGLIGEIGTSWPITAAERKSLVAAAICQDATTAPVMIHPGRNREAPFECMRIFLEAGGRASKCVMAHLDRTLFNIDDFVEFGKFGTYLEWDHFGIETSYYQNNPSVDMPSDAQRIAMITDVIKEGFLEQILISHDIHTRHRLVKYGGHGYNHISRNVIPKMLQRGITKENVDKILIENPRKWLATFT